MYFLSRTLQFLSLEVWLRSFLKIASVSIELTPWTVQELLTGVGTTPSAHWNWAQEPKRVLNTFVSWQIFLRFVLDQLSCLKSVDPALSCLWASCDDMRAVFNLWLIFPVTDKRLLVLSGIPCELGLFFLLLSEKESEQETVGNRHSSQPHVSPKHCVF